MMFCYSKISKIKYFLDPPKKVQGHERSQYVYTHKCFYIQSARDLDNKVITSLKKYYLIIVVFRAHISAFMIFFIHWKTHEVSTKGSPT